MENPRYESLPEVFRSVPVPVKAPRWRQFLAYAGPAFLISVGYMDPGNWGTDLKGGSQFGYALLWVIFLSNLMAQFLQTLAARLGLATGRDLAMLCRDEYKRPAAIALWVLGEIAIVACDLAEVIGSAVGLNLLFGLPLEWGVLITGLDVLLLLGFMKFGFRKIEAIVCTLILTILGCFVYQAFLARPDWPAAAVATVVPSLPGLPNPASLLIAVGILGATVMPHNLYLHSSIVQTRAHERTDEGIARAIKWNTVDTVVALSLAFVINAAILILAASVFNSRGLVAAELQDGYKLVSATMGPAAAVAFAVALLASGQSSTITATLAGQVVMEGFMRWRVKPWVRRIVTRAMAIGPAFFIIRATGGKDTLFLLIVSQVVLSMQLPFATFPLVALTSSREKMGRFANSPLVRTVGYVVGSFIVALNAFLLQQTYVEFQSTHRSPILPWVVGGLAAGAVAFCVWVKFFYRERRPRFGATPAIAPGGE